MFRGLPPIPAIRGLTPVALAVVGLALGACGDTRRVLGYDKVTPDEFKVVSRAPLSLPPDYGLRPPQPGTPRPQEGTIPDQAKLAVTGVATNRGAVASSGSPGEAALLQQAGAGRAQTDIRAVVNQESNQLAQADKTFIDRLIFWRKSEEPGTVVDPQREAQRIRENQALGRTVSDGETPSIKRRRRAPLEGIF